MSSVLYSVARVCPGARSSVRLQLERNVFSACRTRVVIVVILCLLRKACAQTCGGEIHRTHKERDGGGGGRGESIVRL